MIQMRLTDLSNILNVKEINSGQTFKGISVNSRDTMPSNLFVAIKGARFDGMIMSRRLQIRVLLL